MRLESCATVELVQSKREFKMCPNPQNLVLRPVGVGLLFPLLWGLYVLLQVSFMTPNFAALEVVM